MRGYCPLRLERIREALADTLAHVDLLWDALESRQGAGGT
jgi:hypothetical protein